MSGEEKRAIKGAVLLEVEEAKEALALLRAKAEQWRRAHEKVSNLLVKMKRDDAYLESGAPEARQEIANHSGAIAAAMDLKRLIHTDPPYLRFLR